MHHCAISHSRRFHIREKLLPISLALEDILPFIAARGDMRNGLAIASSFDMSASATYLKKLHLLRVET